MSAHTFLPTTILGMMLSLAIIIVVVYPNIIDTTKHEFRQGDQPSHVRNRTSPRRMSNNNPTDEQSPLLPPPPPLLSPPRDDDDKDIDKEKKQRHPDHAIDDDKIKVISILGERQSGIDWLYDELQRCFGHELRVQKGIVRGAHWFQTPPPHSPPPIHHDRTLAVAIFRNPYHWIEKMRRAPHQAPMHANLDWETFVTTPWTAPRDDERDRATTDDAAAPCQEGFGHREVNPCRNKYHRGAAALYEMRADGSGRPYGSILDLRRDKILDTLNVSSTFRNVRPEVLVVRYETLVKEGTKDLLKRVAGATSVSPSCDNPSPAKGYKRPRRLEEDYVRWMDRFVDWDVEGLIGYEKGVFPRSRREGDGKRMVVDVE